MTDTTPIITTPLELMECLRERVITASQDTEDFPYLCCELVEVLGHATTNFDVMAEVDRQIKDAVRMTGGYSALLLPEEIAGACCHSTDLLFACQQALRLGVITQMINNEKAKQIQP